MAKRSEDDYELYLYTIDVYIRLVGALPLDKSLAQFGVQNFSEIGNLDIDDRDFAAVAMRLMLQRKYFVRGKDLFFKGLLKSAEQDFDSGKEVIGLLLADLESLNAQDIEFAFGNGDVVSGLFSNSEDAMYGALLHAGPAPHRETHRCSRIYEDFGPCPVCGRKGTPFAAIF